MRIQWLPLVAIILGLGLVVNVDAQNPTHVSNNLVDNTRNLFVPGALSGQEQSNVPVGQPAKLGKVTYLNPKSSSPIRIAKVFPPLNNDAPSGRSLKTQHLSLAPQQHRGPIVVSVDTPLPNLPVGPTVHQDSMVPVPTPDPSTLAQVGVATTSAVQVPVSEKPIVTLPEPKVEVSARQEVVEAPPVSAATNVDLAELQSQLAEMKTQLAKMKAQAAVAPIQNSPTENTINVPQNVESVSPVVSEVKPEVAEQTLPVVKKQTSTVADAQETTSDQDFVPKVAAVQPVPKWKVPATPVAYPVDRLARNPLKDLPLPQDSPAVHVKNELTQPRPIQQWNQASPDQPFEIRVPSTNKFSSTGNVDETVNRQLENAIQKISSSTPPRNILRASRNYNQVANPQRSVLTGREPFDYSSIDVTPATSLGFLQDVPRYTDGGFGSTIGRPFFGTPKTSCCDEWAGFCPCNEVRGVLDGCGCRTFAERRHFFDGFFDGFSRNARPFGKPGCGFDEPAVHNDCGCDEPTCRTCVNFKLLDINVQEK